MARKKQIQLNVKELLKIEERFPNLKDLTNEELIELLWRQGNLSWKLDTAQKEVYEFFHNCKEDVVVCGVSRQTGKSFTATITGFEYCLKNPGVQVKYAAGDAKAALKAIRSNIMNLCAECPFDLKPSFDRQLGCWKFKNNSVLYLEGLDSGKADSLRGTPAHLIIVDEAAFISDLNYAIYSVLMPMTLTTEGKILIISTPPKSKGHEFMEFVKNGREAGSYFELDIYTYLEKVKNDHDFFRLRLPAERVEKIRKTTPPGIFAKEYLLKYETNMDDAVISEFDADLKARIVKPIARPELYYPYVAMDLGMKDLTAVVFGYYDPIDDKIIIEDELQVDSKKLNTDYLAQEIKRIERELWGNIHGELTVPVKRYCDINEQIAVSDLYKRHGLKFIKSQKDDKAAAIENLRVLLYNEIILINPKCKNLIFHLENATWNKARTSFDRSSIAGHYDFVDAAIYFARAIKRKKIEGLERDVNTGNRFNVPGKSQENQTTTQLKKIFSPKIKRFGDFKDRSFKFPETKDK